MNAAEYSNLAQVERRHWYYSGKRRFVRELILRLRAPARTDRLLDCGAGTGLFAEEMMQVCDAFVLDDHEESLRILRTRFAADRIIALRDGQIDLPDRSVELVTALDVLEHVQGDAAAVRDFYRILKPGGLAVVTVPAGMKLWSDWDESLHHYRRYDRTALKAIFPPDSWSIVHVNYTNVLSYPIVWAVRKWRARQKRLGRPESGIRIEDRQLPPSFNWLLRAIFVHTALWRCPMPFGTSLVLAAVRR